MRIIQVTPYFHPHVGGVESHVFMLSKELMKRGHEVTIYSTRFDKSLKKRDEYKGIKIRRVPQWANLFTTPITPKMFEAISEAKADIIHCHAPPPLTAYYCAKAKKNLMAPLVMTYHCDLELPFFGGGALIGLYRRTLGAYTLNRMDEIIVHTETYAATSRVLWNHHPTVIPTGVDLEKFHPDVDGSQIREKICPEGQRLVMFVGRLMFHKGIEYFINASKYLEDTKFLIVGDGPYRKNLEVSKLNNPKGYNVVFAGNVPDDELPNYYAACDVFVLPSVSRLEGFGLVMVEAMATGKPVVASNMPGMREVMSDGEEGLLAEPLNALDFAHKITILLDDGDLRRRLGENARRTAETRFSWATIGTQVETLYNGMIAGKCKGRTRKVADAGRPVGTENEKKEER